MKPSCYDRSGFLKGLAISTVLAAAPVMTLVLAAPPAPAPADGVRFIGAEQCKNCHKAEKAGNQYGKWTEMKHAKAYERLASEEAKKTGKEKGVDDPQKSDKCLKCHVTAFGKPPELLGKKFDIKQGVQCESCHGPGEKHFKARFAAAQDAEEGAEKEYEAVPEDEITALPPIDTCLQCHNSDSPSFKGLCATEIFKEIMHLDPRKKRKPDEIESLRKKWAMKLEEAKSGCGGPEKCEECKKAGVK